MYGIVFILVGIYCIINTLKRFELEQRVDQLERRELRKVGLGPPW